jgi:hypothetical protein
MKKRIRLLLASIGCAGSLLFLHPKASSLDFNGFVDCLTHRAIGENCAGDGPAPKRGYWGEPLEPMPAVEAPSTSRIQLPGSEHEEVSQRNEAKYSHRVTAMDRYAFPQSTAAITKRFGAPYHIDGLGRGWYQVEGQRYVARYSNAGFQIERMTPHY